jgi:DNA adenine methylase
LAKYSSFSREDLDDKVGLASCTQICEDVPRKVTFRPIFMQFNTPLRYPGGKGKLTDFIKLVFEQNDLLDGHYAEPYAGGAGIAITLLVHSYASRIHLNDLNIALYSFWKSVLDQPDELCQRIRSVRVTMAEWKRQKAIQHDYVNHDTLDLGFSTFFLNRTNRSGILLGGVIGGKEQTGEWKLNARFTKPDLIRRIQKIARFGSRIRLYNQDASHFIKHVLPTLPAKSLVYLDPPYYIKGGELYENHYNHADHVAVAKLVRTQIELPWIVSYDHTPEVLKMYKGCPTVSYGISYSAQDRYKGAEAMFFSKQLVVPVVKNPARIRAA